MIVATIFGIIKSILSICFVLGSIALVHEFGHYVTAKLTGIWVIEFAIGFGNRILKYKWGETIYSIRPFPLGGFVRLAGMAQEEENEEEKKKEEQAGEAAPPTPEKPEEPIDPDDIIPQLDPNDPRGFPIKSSPVKVLVLSAGSAMNMVWAFVLFIIIFTYSGGYLTNLAIMDTIKGQPAEKAGIKAGDIVTAIDGVAIEDWSDGIKMIRKKGGQEIVLDVVRDHPKPRAGFRGGLLQGDHAVNHGTYALSVRETIKVKVVPSGKEGTGMIGISLAPNEYDFKELPFGRSVIKAFDATASILSQTVFGIMRMFTGEAQADVAGPVKIMQMIKDQAKKGLSDLLYLTALLSINIGLINMMPFPVLDGGRIVFVLLEQLFALLAMVTGIKLTITSQMEEKVHFVGLLFLLALLVMVTYKDIKSFF